MATVLPPGFPADLTPITIRGLEHRVAFRLTPAGAAVVFLEIATLEEQEGGRFARPTAPPSLSRGAAPGQDEGPGTAREYQREVEPRVRVYTPTSSELSGREPRERTDILPEPDYDPVRARQFYGPRGPPDSLEELAQEVSRPHRERLSPSEWRVVSFIPPGAVRAYVEWSEPVTEWERRFAGAAYAIWNEYLTVDRTGTVRSGTQIPGTALLPRRRYVRTTPYPQGPFRVENRPGASPVSVPAILGMVYAAHQRPKGAATRIPNALQAHGWTLCGHLQQTALGTYCPPPGAETRKHETLTPTFNVPTVEFKFQAARPGRKGQVSLAGTEPEKVTERERPPVHTAGKQVSIDQIIPLDQSGP